VLPDFETCCQFIKGYKKYIKLPRPENITFPQIWEYKTGLESTGQSPLDEKHIEKTASMLHGFLVYLKMRVTGIAEVYRIEQILREIRPYYNEIQPVSLGSGKIHLFRDQLESIYERLSGITNTCHHNGQVSSIVGKSEVLMAIWGQVPGFDSLIRKRFERWTHLPAPEKLPYLSAEKMWYQPDQFCDIVEELDSWVLAWPKNNDGRIFSESFSDLGPGLPPGRQIDIIYHWKMPDPRVDHQVLSRCS
jgi:hypothetical protein